MELIAILKDLPVVSVVMKTLRVSQISAHYDSDIPISWKLVVYIPGQSRFPTSGKVGSTSGAELQLDAKN